MIEAYTYKRKYFLPFYGGLYSIYFDETEIFKNLTIISAKQITAALNGAYNIGLAQGKLSEQLKR